MSERCSPTTRPMFCRPAPFRACPRGAPKPGDVIVIVGMAFGPVTPNIPAGQLYPGDSQLATVPPLQIFFGSTPATIQYSGLAPNLVGVYQINVVVPNIAASDAVPVTFTLGGVSGAQTLYTSVGN